MTTKREQRKQRSEAERIHRELEKKARKMRSRALFIGVLVVIAGLVTLGITRRQQSLRVWSAEHGHWHDK